MKTLAIIAGIIACSPLLLVLAVAAKLLRSKRTPEMGTLADDDPGVDVDVCIYCEAGERHDQCVRVN